MPLPSSDLPGHRQLRDQVQAALDSCVERPYVEFKESQPWEKLKQRIAKIAMSMANLRDGGMIIIGVSEQSEDSWTLEGVHEEHLPTYDQDDTDAFVNAHADPPLSLTVLKHKHDEHEYVVILVREFDDLPVVCKKNSGEILKAGAFYVRPRNMACSRPVESASEMRDLLDLAAEHRTRKLLETMRRVGASSTLEEVSPFDDELEGL
ncbi:MAG: ATP-binding protein [Phycisphaerales bacterium]|nr:ATP-binding protein [Phycisphaerales bacterium]